MKTYTSKKLFGGKKKQVSRVAEYYYCYYYYYYIFPTLWKQAAFAPIFKKGKTALMNNHISISILSIFSKIQGDTKKRELLKNPTKIEEIQEKILLTEIEPLQLAF